MGRPSGDLLPYPMPLSEEELYGLLERAKGGDEESMWTIVVHNMRLVGMALGKLKVRREEYNDMMEECIFVLIACVKGFSAEKGKWAGYACRALFRHLIRLSRKSQKIREMQKPLNEDAMEQYEMPDNALCISANGSAVDTGPLMREKMRECMARLPSKMRATMEMRMQGLSLNEIGRRVGHSQQSIHQREKSAIRRLRVLMGVI
jgi:RNA polymerase sigma factor (sigma-70 family)